MKNVNCQLQSKNDAIYARIRSSYIDLSFQHSVEMKIVLSQKYFRTAMKVLFGSSFSSNSNWVHWNHFFQMQSSSLLHARQELFPGQYKPTPTHNFIRLLNDHGLLLRCFTQNIDSLETEAGLPKDKVVAAHGNFDAATCISTGEKVPEEGEQQAS